MKQNICKHNKQEVFSLVTKQTLFEKLTVSMSESALQLNKNVEFYCYVDGTKHLQGV